jgi:hypothetical protein
MNHTTKRVPRLLLSAAALGLALAAVGTPVVAMAASDFPPGPNVTAADYPPGPNVAAADLPPGPGIIGPEI